MSRESLFYKMPLFGYCFVIVYMVYMSSSLVSSDHKVCNIFRDCREGCFELCSQCTFMEATATEGGMCGYFDSGYSDSNNVTYFGWEVLRLNTSYGNSGAQVESSLDARGDHWKDMPIRGQLTGPLLANSPDLCTLSFTYFFDGNIEPTIALKVDGNDTKPFEVWNWFWSSSGPGQSAKGSVRLGRVREPFRVTFIADTKPQEVEPHFSLRDIKLSGCQFPVEQPTEECQSDTFQCNETRTCIPSNFICDMTDDCGDNSDESHCEGYHRHDFESVDSDWKLEFMMKRSASQATFVSGPTRDHSSMTNTGHFALLYSSDRLNSLGRLTSPQLRLNDECVLVFYVNIIGAHLPEVSVKYDSYDPRNMVKTHVLHTIEGHTSEFGVFERVEVPIKSESDEYSVYIQVNAEMNATHLVFPFRFSYVAIDDLSLSPQCFIFNNKTLPATTETPIPGEAPSQPSDPSEQVWTWLAVALILAVAALMIGLFVFRKKASTTPSEEASIDNLNCNIRS